MGSPVRHAVILVHGQGDGQVPGDQLAAVANGIADCLENAGGQVLRDFRMTGASAEGTLTVARPGSPGPDDVFLFREAYWAQSLPVAPPDAVAKWMLRLGPREATQVIRGWWRNAANDRIDDADGGGKGSTPPAPGRAPPIMSSSPSLPPWSGPSTCCPWCSPRCCSPSTPWPAPAAPRRSRS